MNSLVFSYKWNKFQSPRASFRAALGGVIYKLTGGRILTKEAARHRAKRSNAWANHSATIQRLLDQERANGYGFSVLTGRRIDF